MNIHFEPKDEEWDGETLWVVWEGNSIIPKLFTTRDGAYAYRDKRLHRDRVRHQVYVMPSKINEAM